MTILEIATYISAGIVALIAIYVIIMAVRVNRHGAAATMPFSTAPVLIGASFPPTDVPRSKIRSGGSRRKCGGESSRHRKDDKRNRMANRCHRNQNYRTGG